MREKLNENPLAQVGLIGVLLLAGVLLLTTMGGGGSESESESAAAPEASTATAPEGSTATGAPAITPAGETPSTGVAGPPPSVPGPPRAVTSAYDANRTVAILVVREGGIDDRMVRADTQALAGVPGVALFVVPVRQISRYAAITQGVGVNRVPALVVLRPKALTDGIPTASVDYGYQDAQDVLQAVVDARYDGRTLPYHP